MSIEEIVKALADRGVNSTAEQVEALLSQSKIKPEEVTAAAIVSIADELKRQGKGAIQKSGGSKVTAKNRRSTRKQRTEETVIDLGRAIATVGQASGLEIEAIRGAVHAQLGLYVEQTSQDIVDSIREAPNAVLRRVGELALEEAPDAEFFRSRTSQAFSQLFPVSKPTSVA